MRIGFDAKRAVQNFTGLGNYSRYVIDILCRFYPENEYIAYAPKRIENKQTDRLLNRHPGLSLKLPTGFLWRKARSLWRVWGISGQMEKEHTELFHGLSNELPLNIRRKKIKSIVTIHDLIFLRYPRFYKRIDRAIYSFKFRKACRNADRIIAISECTKRDIVSFFDIDPGKIEVVYQGCDACFSHEATEQQKQEVRQRYSLPRKYVLNVGSIEERKNALLAIKAMEGLPDEVHLVIVGKHTPYTDKIKSYADEKGLARRIRFIHNLPFADLPAVYQMATVFIYPSRFEGFGIPILEALHSGVPVVAATGSCLEEAGGPYSIYVDPDNVEETAAALRLLCTDEAQRKEMIEKGKEFAASFSEEQQAEQLMEIYKKVLHS